MSPSRIRPAATATARCEMSCMRDGRWLLSVCSSTTAACGRCAMAGKILSNPVPVL